MGSSIKGLHSDDQVQLSHYNGRVTMVTIFKHCWSHVDWCEICIDLRIVKVNVVMVEITGLEIIASRPLTCPP
jgi:hypothetical protein